MKPKKNKKEGSGLKGRSEKRRRKGKKRKTRPLQMNPQHRLHPVLMMKRRGGRKRSVRRMKSADDAKKRRGVYRILGLKLISNSRTDTYCIFMFRTCL